MNSVLNKFDYFYNKASSSFRRNLVQSFEGEEASSFQAQAEAFVSNGIIGLPGYFSEHIQALGAEFAGMIEKSNTSIGRNSQEDGVVDLGHMSIGNTGFASSPLASKLAFDPYLLKLVGYYFGKNITLTQVGGTRLLPRDIDFDYRSMQWHHDTKGKQVKIFILLTDVATDGQCTHFVCGSHMGNYDRKDNGRRSQAQVDQMMKNEGKSIARAAGQAGTVWILDTNGLHRGNRNMSATRDVLVYNYTAGRHKFDFDLHPDVQQNKHNLIELGG